MDKIDNLVSDLKKLNKRYKELNSDDFDLPRSLKEVYEKRRKLIESGNLLIDFYNNSFLPNYAHSSNGYIHEAGLELQDLAKMAGILIKKKNYFGLSVFLIDMGSREGDPNSLEKIIEDLRKHK